MTHDGKRVRLGALGADIRGTFTAAIETGATLHSTKALTNYDESEQGILDDIEKMAANSLIERSGVKTAFLTTEGFREVMNWSARVLSRVIPPQPARQVEGGDKARSSASRRIYDARLTQLCDSTLMARDDLSDGSVCPALPS